MRSLSQKGEVNGFESRVRSAELGFKGRNLGEGVEVQKGVKNCELEEVRVKLQWEEGRGMREGRGTKTLLRCQQGFDKVPKEPKELDKTEGSQDEELKGIETRLRARSLKIQKILNRWMRKMPIETGGQFEEYK